MPPARRHPPNAGAHPGVSGGRAGRGSKWLAAALAAAILLSAAGVASALDGRGAARLKRAGVGDKVIAAMVRERSVETGAFSVEDVLAMKAAGIGDPTLESLIVEGSFLKGREPVVYGSDIRPVHFASVADIVRLKQAGVGDDVLRAVVAASRPAAAVEREEALRLLERWGLWLEVRP